MPRELTFGYKLRTSDTFKCLRCIEVDYCGRQLDSLDWPES